MDSPCHGQTVFDRPVMDGMAAREETACFLYLFRPAAQDVPENAKVLFFRKGDDIERRQYPAAHGVDIAQGIGCANLAEHVRVRHHRREKVYGLDEGQVIPQADHCRIIRPIKPDEQILALPARKVPEKRPQIARPYFGIAAAADDELIIIHSITSKFFSSPNYFYVIFIILLTRKKAIVSCKTAPASR